MKFNRSIPLLLIVAVMAQSCVSTKKYQQLQASYNQLDSNTRNLNGKYLLSERNVAVLTNRVSSLEEQLAAERANSKSLQDALTKALNASSQGNVNVSKLVDEINSW